MLEVRRVGFAGLVCLLLGLPLALACASPPEEGGAPEQAAAAAPAPVGPVTTVYRAARIHTMDPARPVATAVAVREGRIVAVGDAQALTRELGPDARLDERFATKTLLPGFVDNHLHPILAALVLPMEFATPFAWDLPGRRVEGVLGRPAFVARLRALESAHPLAAPLFVWGYHPFFHDALSRADLNGISHDRPIVVWHRSFHELIANDAALAWMGLAEEDVAGHAGVDWERGHFFETGLPLALAKLTPTLLAPDWLARGLELTARAVHAGGVTTIADMGVGTFDLARELAAMREHLETPDTPFRTLLVPNALALFDALGAYGAYARIGELESEGGERLRTAHQIKLFSDGAFYSQLMQMSEGYSDGHEGVWLMTPDELLETARPYWNAGYQIHVHANGDLGVRAALDALEALERTVPRADHRFTLHHVGYSTEAQAARIAELGALVSANPWYLWSLGEAYSVHGLGPERAAHMVRLGALVRAGVPVSLHSDFTMAPVQPLRLAWVAANRITAGGNVFAPDERLDVAQALRAVTSDAAFAIGMENEIGSIEAGKRADFTVLERDPLEGPPEALGDVPIWGTVFEGRPFPIEP